MSKRRRCSLTLTMGTASGHCRIQPTSDVAGFWVWGDGESDYTTAVASLCAEGMVMQTLLAQGLHQHLLPAHCKDRRRGFNR